MANPTGKLNPYVQGAKSEDMFIGKMKGKISIQRFQWVLEGKLARCAQPGYGGGDQPHSVNLHDAYFLTSKNIRQVISVNSRPMTQAGQTVLSNAGIAFHHFPIPDYHAPTPWELWEVARLIDTGRGASIIYCGYGAGRTGTFVAGWAKLKIKPMIKGMDKKQFLHDNFGVEAPCQYQVLNNLVPNGPAPAHERTVNPGPQPTIALSPPQVSGIPMPPPVSGGPLPTGGGFANFAGPLSGLSLPGNASPPGFGGSF